ACWWVTRTRSNTSRAAPWAAPAPTTRPPSRWNTATVAAPIPPLAPVTTQTLFWSLTLSSCRVVDRLDLGVGVERVRAELATVAGLLEPAERSAHAHGRVRVDRQDSRLHATRHAQRASAVARPDRARQPVDRVVGQANRLVLVVERDHRDDRSEDLLPGDAVGRLDGREHRWSEPEAGALRRAPLEGDRRLVI